MILMLTATCTVYADDHQFYATSSDMEIVKKNVHCFSNVWCSTLLCFALKKFKWENSFKALILTTYHHP